mgnify:CR=1 FL=1
MSMSKTLNGKIIKGIGGFYYVEAANQVYECRRAGFFARKKQHRFAEMLSPYP